MSAATSSDTLHTLSDIRTEEVSLVDHAANRRRLLVVKNEGNMGTKSTEVVGDGKGGHTATTKEDPVTPAAPAAAPPAPAATPAQPAATPEVPKLRISPEAKAELAKRVSGAMEKLGVLKGVLDGTEEVAGLTDVPSALIEGFGDILHLLAEGDGTAATATPAAKAATAAIAKGKKQISSAREAHLRSAYSALGTILSELDAAPATETPAPAVEPVASDDVVAKRVASLEATVTKMLGSVTATLEKQNAAIAKQGAEIERVEKASGAGTARPSNGSNETDPAPVKKGESFTWDLDLNKQR